MRFNCYYNCLLLVLIIVLHSCTSYKYSYEQDDLPAFKGDYRHLTILPDTNHSPTIKVVSFNIEFAQNIEGAIALFQQEPLQSADVVLLQEMDEKGTDRMARRLHMNYTFYPSIYHPKHGQNVGNAILTKWDIQKCQKVKLPHPSTYMAPLKGRNYIFRKTATIADIKIIGNVIRFASTHAAAFNTTQKRKEFAEALVNEFENSTIDMIVVGGDFNSLGSADIQATTTPFTNSGFIWASENIGKTINTPKTVLKPIPKNAFQLDHLFVRGMHVNEVGKVHQDGVSDHLPIWVELTIEKSKHAN